MSHSPPPQPPSVGTPLDKDLSNLPVLIFPASSSTLFTPMPPPNVIFAAPPIPTYTLTELLAYQPQMPSPPSGISASIVDSKTKRPTHSSSLRSMKYEWIHEQSLRRVMGCAITSFRDRLQAMNSLRFDQPMALPWNASPMLSEGCVTGYLDAQILGAAWQAVLQMVPKERDYDLQMAKQIPVVDGVPDQTYSILRGEKCEALALVEFKSIGVVNGMVSVIENAAQGIKTDTTDDWKAVTRQLRMYAASSNIRDVLVLDECVGIYFCFPEDPNESGHQHDFLYASTKLGPDFGVNPRLSLRELVVYAILSSLDRKNIELRDFAADGSPITVGPNIRPYRNVLPGIAPAPSSKKRQGSSSSTHTRRQGSKRGKPSEPVPHDRFDRFILVLELLPDMAPVATRGRISSRDSGFYDATDRTPPKKDTPPAAKLVAAPVITLHVERILKDTVALVTDGASHFIAKLFPTHSDKDSARRLAAELAVYTECATVQGTFIPYLQGVYRFCGASAHNTSLVMLTEYIGAGTTIASIIEALYEIPDGNADDDLEFERGMNRLAKLHDRAKTALEALHRRKVVHADVVARNIVVDENDNVVLVDFGYSLVLRDDLARFRVRRDDDLAQLRNAFAVEE